MQRKSKSRLSICDQIRITIFFSFFCPLLLRTNKKIQTATIEFSRLNKNLKKRCFGKKRMKKGLARSLTGQTWWPQKTMVSAEANAIRSSQIDRIFRLIWKARPNKIVDQRWRWWRALDAGTLSSSNAYNTCAVLRTLNAIRFNLLWILCLLVPRTRSTHSNVDFEMCESKEKNDDERRNW